MVRSLKKKAEAVVTFKGARVFLNLKVITAFFSLTSVVYVLYADVAGGREACFGKCFFIADAVYKV